MELDYNLSDQIVKDFHKKVLSEFELRLKSYLKKNLSQIGYQFSTEPEFLNFCKERITRSAFAGDPNYYEFYLDFVNEENCGTLIGSYSDKIDFKMEGNKVTATVGTKFN
jgi:hypothetical protein